MTCHAKTADCNGTCNVGSLGHYAADAATYAAWSMDFMKMDWCSASVAKLKCEDQYREMASHGLQLQSLWIFHTAAVS